MCVVFLEMSTLHLCKCSRNRSVCFSLSFHFFTVLPDRMPFLYVTVRVSVLRICAFWLERSLRHGFYLILMPLLRVTQGVKGDSFYGLECLYGKLETFGLYSMFHDQKTMRLDFDVETVCQQCYTVFLDVCVSSLEKPML